MTPTQRLAELHRACEEATPGPWVLTGGEWIADRGGDDDTSQIVCEQPEEHCDRSRANWPHNARFIALAREALPELLAEIAELRERTLPFDVLATTLSTCSSDLTIAFGTPDEAQAALNWLTTQAGKTDATFRA